jgi:DNA-binding SARP family transcriptional activator
MVTLTVRLFGRFDACSDGQPTTALNARRARELLSYLVLHRNHPQQREALAGLLWEDAPPGQSRKYLRQALWQIQTALHPCGEREGEHVLEVDPEWIQLNGGDRLKVDVTRFQEATSSCHGIPGPQLDDAGLQQLEEAVDLYRGGLLEGWYQDWCLFERERLQNDFLAALEKLVCSCEARCDSECGLAHARRMLAIDPACEQVHRHIMQLHVLAGNRTEALRAFQRCERVLMHEFGVRPSHQTSSLYESIREERADSHGTRSIATPPTLARDQLRAVMDLLERVQSAFAGIETRLRKDIAGPSELE